MGIAYNTALFYVHSSKEQKTQYDRKRRGKKQESLVDQELKYFNLPMEWKQEVSDLLKDYKEKTSLQGIRPKQLIHSLLILTCHRHRFPTPKNLSKIAVKRHRTHEGQPKTAYFSVLEKMDGLERAKPADYINSFFREKPQYQHLLPKALDIAEKLPFSFKSKNPRNVAGACIYISSFNFYDAGSRCVTEIKQEAISDYFGVADMSIRNVYTAAVNALSLKFPRARPTKRKHVSP